MNQTFQVIQNLLQPKYGRTIIYLITFIKLSLKSEMVSLHILPKLVLNPKNKKELHYLDSVFNYIEDLIYVYNE